MVEAEQFEQAVVAAGGDARAATLIGVHPDTVRRWAEGRVGIPKTRQREVQAFVDQQLGSLVPVLLASDRAELLAQLDDMAASLSRMRHLLIGKKSPEGASASESAQEIEQASRRTEVGISGRSRVGDGKDDVSQGDAVDDTDPARRKP